ncbi:hypothetical protein F4553_005361 [Allocatelliglobosispora scoriae]|uniref:DNA helicase DnaB-like N-terminal domain-containing protein n=1 Tax=Allocatelliglobosispora scoriae TaxID=643052 RepID=A0A841BYU9_9ACTN|nr:DUF3987 domain-containing protein [Allocatelliglobosispora scoriae]MBB5871982.1 hypothetical protein [Allocatelliglobosispora scoriae]
MTATAAFDNAAEQAVLGAALLAPDTLDTLGETLTAADFYRPAHATLWEHLTSLRALGSPVDPVTVGAHLATVGDLDRLGGAPYLHTLMQAVPSVANASHYAGIISGHAQRRRVVQLGHRLTQAAQTGDPTTALAEGYALLGDQPTPSGWQVPVPLGDKRHLPEFPAHMLPAWVASYVLAVAEFTQTPVDLAGSVALAALSTAAGGRAEVEVRGSWREPVNLYTVAVLPPGSRKSAVFACMISPLLCAERALAERMRPVIIEAELAAKVAGKAAEKAANVAANAPDPAVRDSLIADAAAAAMHAEGIRVPAKPRLIADDVTSEKAASLLAEQGGRLAVLSPEGGIFATLAGRYSGTPNLEVFLKGHAGDMLLVDRTGRPSEHVEKPALTLGLAVQPDVLRDIAGMPGFRGKGLLARILFSVPENTVGYRKIGADTIPHEVTEVYTTSLTALVATLAEWTDPAVLPLTRDANERVLDLEREVEPLLAPSGAWGHIVDWGSKYVGAVIRIAGLIHLAEHLRDGWGKAIDADTLDRAIVIGRYYAAHALAAFDDMGADRTTQHARTVLAWLTRTDTTTFTKRDLLRALKSHMPTTADIDPVLSLLELHGYIRPADPAPRPATGRPPSAAYLVNPEVHRPAATLTALRTERRSA